MPKRVILAMSGGVDSSVAAYLLKQQGYDVIGLFMRTGVHDDAGAEENERRKGCCSGRDACDARRVADRLGIPFHALDFQREFGQVMDYFADEYIAGRTPNPCIVCNSWVKFGRLWAYGQAMQADCIATGHYARIHDGVDGPELHAAADADKDQSYVLFGLRRSLLPRVLFPVGDYRKPQVRELAREAGLRVADKPDSVDICFVPDGDHAALVRRRRPELATAGRIVDTRGTVLAEHDGIERFTVGQRKGLGFGAGRRRYVLRIIPDTNEVIVGDRDELRTTGLHAARVNWLTASPPAGPVACQVKIRYHHEPAEAVVQPLTAGFARVTFTEPQSAVAPGQAVVFYDGPRVLGGGWIETAEADSPRTASSFTAGPIA